MRDKDEVLKRVESRYARAKIDKLDGISVIFQDYWFNIRPSNTEPVIRLRLEAVNRDLAEARTREIRKFVESIG
ncbi:Phosphoglucosamine mutase [subsurface metagenome]